MSSYLQYFLALLSSASELASASVVMIFVCVEATPLVLAHAYGLKVVAAELTTSASGSLAVTVAQRVAKAALGSSYDPYYSPYGTYADGAGANGAGGTGSSAGLHNDTAHSATRAA